MNRTEKKAILLQHVVNAQGDLEEAAVAYAARRTSPEALRNLLAAGRAFSHGTTSFEAY